MSTQTSAHCSLKPNHGPIFVAIFLAAAFRAAALTPLVPLPGPQIVDRPSIRSDGDFGITNLFDGRIKTEFASADAGTNTVVHLRFDKPYPITALRHFDRNDPATIAESELELLDAGGRRVVLFPVTHVNQRGGETLFILPQPVVAQGANWRVTKLGSPGLYSVGGAALTFYTTDVNDASPKRDSVEVKVLPFLEKNGARPVKVTIQHPYQEAVDVTVKIGGGEPKTVHLKSGENILDWSSAEVTAPQTLTAEVQFNGERITQGFFRQSPARPMTIYVLPHSHTDIGYTEIQTAIEKKQVKNLADGIAAARKTADYPEDSRFVWNVEVGWAADLYLERMNDAQRNDFFDAVKKGQVALNGMYLNELTGLCRPEELVQLFHFATRMSRETGVPVDTAMISDVPGYTWGTVTAMSQAGIKYLSAAPNYFDRIGTILKEWENKPFYWVAPDGKNKTLVWIPFWGYAMSHIYNQLSPHLIADFYDGIEQRNYPYEMAYVRWAGHGDNAVPDPEICNFIRDWNAKYQWPHFVISGASKAFHAFEARYGSTLPQVKGDWTPYWEDGAGSSALQTSENRLSSDRLSQAATAFALYQPHAYPAADFNLAWRNVLLYSEHTWGAWCSISGPDRKETTEQWAGKKAYADNADKASRTLLTQALAPEPGHAGEEFAIVNTLSWERTEFVTLSADQSRAGDRIVDGNGNPVPSQRLVSGELAFLAEKVPPFASKRYSVSAGSPAAGKAEVKVGGSNIENKLIRVRVDETTGGISELSAIGIQGNLVDTNSGETLNDYRYFTGDDASKVRRNGPVTITVGERGPLVGSLIIESEAPGCNKLRRELRVCAGQDFVEIRNWIDKTRLEAKNYYEKDGKESLNFAFPFNIPNGNILVDIPLGAMRPEADQIPSACKNWLVAGRWVDVANDREGVTWVTLDAPLIEVGGLTANLLNSQTNPDVWRKNIARSQKLYSWSMNNHWGTNYRARQEGDTWFRFVLRPHRGPSEPAGATRFARGFSEPLLVSRNPLRDNRSFLQLSSADVTVNGMKPSEDGAAIIIRLFGASGKDNDVKLQWGASEPKAVYLSNTSEAAGEKVGDHVSVPGFGLVTLRAEF